MDNGFLRVEGRIARVGVQEYRRADGTVHRELRLPEEVFDADSLASFAQLPVTNCHPPGMLTSKNAKRYQVGSVGENVRKDEDYVAAPLMITDSDAIESIEKGRTQLSCGYSCEMDTAQDPALVAKWGPYDSIQRKIRGNHVATVDVARAGPGASIRLDDTAAVALEFISMTDKSDNAEKEPMHRFQLDGMNIDVSDANAQAIIERAISAQRDRADAADKRSAELSAKVEALTAKATEQAEELAKMDGMVADRVKSLGALGAQMAKLGVDVSKLDASEDAYLRAGLQKRNPSLKLDGRDLNTLRSFWEALASVPEPSAVDMARAGLAPGQKREDAADGSADAARRRYNERLFSVAK